MPPKSRKKNPPSAFGMFINKRRAELEAEGMRFPRGFDDVAFSCNPEWQKMSKEDKDVYAQMAKEAKEKQKLDLTNKFTTTGESYAELQERQEKEKKLHDEMEKLIDNLTTSSDIPPEERNFILIRTTHTCHEHHSDTYWPGELAIGAFNIKKGLICQYSTMIDTVDWAPDYASDVQEACDENALMLPGSNLFGPDERDYKKLIRNVKIFIERYLADYPRDYVIFAMDDLELKSAKGCLQWLFENGKDSIPEGEIPVWERFFQDLKFYSLPRLFLRLALITKAKNPNYNNVLAQYKDLDLAAITILNNSQYDYRQDITCGFHKIREFSHKMNMCCKNIVLRRIYLLVGHLVKGMELPPQAGHDIEMYTVRTKPRPATPPLDEDHKEVSPKKPEEDDDEKEEEEEEEEKEDKELSEMWESGKSSGVLLKNPLATTKPNEDSSDKFDNDSPAPSAGFTIHQPATSAAPTTSKNGRQDDENDDAAGPEPKIPKVDVEEDSSPISSGFTIRPSPTDQVPFGLDRKPNPEEEVFPSFGKVPETGFGRGRGVGRGRGSGGI